LFLLCSFGSNNLHSSSFDAQTKRVAAQFPSAQAALQSDNLPFPIEELSTGSIVDPQKSESSLALELQRKSAEKPGLIVEIGRW
jgi:hypothetical protein